MPLTPLDQGIQAARTGDKPNAIQYFAQAIHQNPNNATAWLWLSSVVDDPQKKKDCLERVLKISPNNKVARETLIRLNQTGELTAPKENTQPSNTRKPSLLSAIQTAAETPTLSETPHTSNTERQVPTAPQIAPSVEEFLGNEHKRNIEPVVQLAPIPDLRSVIKKIRSDSYEERINGLEAIRIHKMAQAAPYVLEMLRNTPRSWGKYPAENLNYYRDAILGTLEMTGGSIAQEIYQITREKCFPVPVAPVNYIPVFCALNHPELALGILQKSIKPSKTIEYRNARISDGRNLRSVLMAGEINHPQTAEILCENIDRERKSWRPGIVFGYVLLLTDPTALLITGVLSLATSIAANVIAKSEESAYGRTVSSLMVHPQSVEWERFNSMPVPLRMMTAYHCYSTALVGAANYHPVSVQQQFNIREHPIEKAIIGLALAQNGNAKIQEWLVHLAQDSSWDVRILAYEGLVALDHVLGRNPGNNQLVALRDPDARVTGAVASAMVSTGNPYYSRYVVSLMNSPSDNHRESALASIAVLAKNGDRQAISVLSQAAERDSKKSIRQSAAQIIQVLGK